jgi:hypothetical protein
MLSRIVAGRRSVRETIRNGRFVEVLGETPLLSHCTAVK